MLSIPLSSVFCLKIKTLNYSKWIIDSKLTLEFLYFFFLGHLYSKDTQEREVGKQGVGGDAHLGH